MGLASAPTQRVVHLEESRGGDWLRWLCETYRFRAVGMRSLGAAEAAGAEGEGNPRARRRGRGAEAPARAWVLVRPGIARPLAVRAAPHHVVFDLNGVLAAKMVIGPAAAAGWAHVRLPPPSPVAFLVRPGAAKLLRMLAAEGHWVWLWSTMQPATVRALAAALAPFLPAHRLLAAPDCAPGNVKDLRTVWRRAGSAFHADAEARRDAAAPLPEHTLLFDDDPAKVHPEQTAHFVRVSPFAPASPWDPAAVADREMLRLLALFAARVHSPERQAA